MRRRDFIKLVGSAMTWPSAVRAQQLTIPTIGLLHIGSPGAYQLLEYFRQGLRESGYSEGQNVVIEYRWAEGQTDRLSELAADLVRRRVSVIAAVSGTNGVLAAKAATKTIPIVFLTGGDPVNLGLVSSLNRPEANVTGVSFIVEDLGAKEMGLLHELVPEAKKSASS
jgi:putative ABC transport system substrate-binding protein